MLSALRIAIVYLLVRRILRRAILVFRADHAKDVELPVLRHENAALITSAFVARGDGAAIAPGRR